MLELLVAKQRDREIEWWLTSSVHDLIAVVKQYSNEHGDGRYSNDSVNNTLNRSKSKEEQKTKSSNSTVVHAEFIDVGC